ncbi:MAG: SAM-dependent methyltransferase [Alphaproteobacteria bacterium]|nr:SAM-dependent methyltransferase [Alphaproteobacteria bacterium]
MGAARAIQQMHERCAVYTSPPVAARLLDIIGWTEDSDLTSSVLLEPCVGEGAILLEGVRRLLASFRSAGLSLTQRRLSPRIKGFEFHPATAALARRRLELALLREGLAWNSARDLAAEWVQQRDFLLANPGRVTHVAANPPYLRWGKLPPSLADQYRETLRMLATRGDVAVAFLDRMMEWTRAGGRIAALISDRWMFAQYGAEFLADSSASGWTLEVVDERPENPFVRQVGAYSAIVRFTRGVPASEASYAVRGAVRSLHSKLVAKHGTIMDAGCIVKVGPALGCGHTFLVTDDEAATIERELIWPYVGREDLLDGKAETSTLKVVVPYDRRGRPIDIGHWPGFAAWARKHEPKLKSRSHVREDGPWWKTIDAIGLQWRQSPKLLLAELCREPRVSLDRTGGLPAHSLYAIWPGEWPIEVLQRVLNGGLLRLTAEAEAPMLKVNWFRFYKRFLVRTPLPKWGALPQSERCGLADQDPAEFSTAFEALFGFPPGELPT